MIHCENPAIVVFTSHHALPHWKLEGCRHISFYSVGTRAAVSTAAHGGRRSPARRRCAQEHTLQGTPSAACFNAVQPAFLTPEWVTTPVLAPGR